MGQGGGGAFRREYLIPLKAFQDFVTPPPLTPTLGSAADCKSLVLCYFLK